MITVTEHALEAMGIRSESILGAIQDVRNKVLENGPGTVSKRSVDLVNELLGTTVDTTDIIIGVQNHVADDFSMMVAQAVAEEVVRHVNQPIDEITTLVNAKVRISKLMALPDNSWMFVKPTPTSTGGPTTDVALIAGLDIKVAIKEDGSIKKGGKQTIAMEMYKQRVIESGKPVTNQEFIAMLVAELGMTSAGAITYAGNCDRPHKLLVKKAKKEATA